MPSNPEKDKQKAWRYVDNILTNVLPTLEDGLHINELIKQTIITFPVPALSVKKFINDYYIDLAVVELTKENILLFKFEKKKKGVSKK